MSLAVTYIPSHELTERFMINLSHRYLTVPPSQPPNFAHSHFSAMGLTAHGLQSRDSDIAQ